MIVETKLRSFRYLEAVAFPIMFSGSQRARELERAVSKMEYLAPIPHRHHEDDCQGIAPTMKCAFCGAV